MHRLFFPYLWAFFWTLHQRMDYAGFVRRAYLQASVRTGYWMRHPKRLQYVRFIERLILWRRRVFHEEELDFQK